MFKSQDFIKKFGVFIVIIGLIIFAGCETGSGGNGGGSDPATSTEVSGVICDCSGLPLEGASVTAVLDDYSKPAVKAASMTTGKDGKFTLSDISYNSFYLKVVANGKMTLIVRGFKSSETYAPISLLQTVGDEEVTFTIPDNPTLAVARNGSTAELGWTKSTSSDFYSYRIMRSGTTGVDFLGDCRGVFMNAANASMNDVNMGKGTWYYRVYQVLKVNGNSFLFGSNEVSLEIPENEAMPDYSAFLMLKTLPAAGSGYEHQARYVFAPDDNTEVMPDNRTVSVDSPLFGSIVNGVYAVAGYKKVKNYYYGYPAVYLGECALPGEWESKYFVKKDDFTADSRIGEHKMTVDGGEMTLDTFTTGMPESKVYNIQLQRDAYGRLEITWDMIEDGNTFAGGTGNYGWVYFVKVMGEGQYSGGSDSTYQYENYWSSIYIRDKGFTRICEAISNYPQVASNSILVPEGIFTQGETVRIALYAISKDKFTGEADSSLGIGKYSMYWLFMGGDHIVP